MAYPILPDFLPLPQQDGYGFKDAVKILRTEMDDGLSRQRKTYPNTPSSLSVTWQFTDEELAVFDAWHEQYTSSGADWFSSKIVTPGSEIKEEIVRIVADSTSVSLLTHGYWEVSATLDIKKRFMMDKSTVDLLITYRYDDLLNASKIAHNYVELRYPEIIIP